MIYIRIMELRNISQKQVIGCIVLGAATYISVRWFIKNYYLTRNNDSKNEERNEIVRRRSLDSLPAPSISQRSVSFSATAHSICSYLSDTSIATNSMMFFDTEPNLHFFKIFQDALVEVTMEKVPMTRTDRTDQLFCESRQEFLAKVACLRLAFQQIVHNPNNCNFFVDGGKEILTTFLSHSEHDLEKCLEAYEALLKFVADIDNHDLILSEINNRSIPLLSFYDLVVDYIILESLDDLNNPPAVVTSLLSNTWVSSKFRQSACQSAVSRALKYKRSQLKSPDGFFAHFYSVLDYLSPTLAWGFLGSDEDLKLKCNLLKESMLGLCRDYFSFDRVRYTTYDDLQDDIMRVTRERYWDLTDRLGV